MLALKLTVDVGHKNAKKSDMLSYKFIIIAILTSANIVCLPTYVRCVKACIYINSTRLQNYIIDLQGVSHAIVAMCSSDK